MISYWPSLLVSATWIIICIVTLPNDGVFLGQRVSVMCIYFVLACCTVTAALSIRGLLRGRGKIEEKEYTDEDAAKAKDELEKMYLNQHGRLPEYSEEIKKTFGSDKDDRTKGA